MFKHLFNEINNFLILASKQDDIKNLVYSKFPHLKQDIDKLIQSDPSGKLKYLLWQCKMLDSEQLLVDELIDITRAFDKHKESPRIIQKDLNQYKPEQLASLRNTLFNTSNKRIEGGESGGELVYKSKNFKVFLIKNRAGAEYYGSESKWCIAVQNKAYFEDYDKNNVIFFIIYTTKEFPHNRIAVSLQRDINNSIKEVKYWTANDKSYDRLDDLFLDEADKIDVLVRNIAERQPKSLFARVGSGEGTERDFEELWRMSEDVSIEKDVRKRYKELYIQINRNIPEEAQEILAKDQDSNVRQALAKNPNIPEKVQEILVKDQDSNVRQILAFNRNLTEKIQEILAKDQDKFVRQFLAENPNITEKIQEILAKDEDYNVRQGLAENPNLTDRVKQLLNQ